MRPRKRVLLYSDSEHTTAILRVVLESKIHYAVETVMSVYPDAFLLVGFSLPEHDAFEAQRWQACPLTSVVVVPARGLHPESEWMADLLAKLHLATCRKRGPKGRMWHEFSQARKAA